MVLAVCARSEVGVSVEDRERAVSEGIARAVVHARWAFPARDTPAPVVRRFRGAALVSWSNEPREWSLAAEREDGGVAVDGVGYVDSAYSGSGAVHSPDLLRFSTGVGGCFNLFRASDHRIEALTDSTKSNSVYFAQSDRLSVVASRALLAHMVVSQEESPVFDLAAIATMTSRGYFLGDGTPYSGVSALGVAEYLAVTPDSQVHLSAVPTSEGSEEGGLSENWRRTVSAAADALLRAFEPLTDSEVHLSLTGGRDSRVIAAALAHLGDVSVSAHTMGLPTEPDVIIAADIAKLAGWAHTVQAPSRTSSSGSEMFVEDPVERITRVLDVHDGMNSAWDDIEDYGNVVERPIMSGVGGEVLRGGLVLTSHASLTPELAERELRAALGDARFVQPQYAPTHGRRYLELVEKSPFRAIDEFYLHERNGRWVASRRMGARFRRRVIDPLLDNRFVRETRQIDPEVRWAERLAFEIVALLYPPMRDLRLEGNRWRFERGGPHPDYREGWSARSALVSDARTVPLHWKNLTDATIRNRVDSLILDSIGSGMAAELLNRSRVEQLLSAENVYPPLRWYLATTGVMLSTPWWQTARKDSRESIALPVPGAETSFDPELGADADWLAVSVIVPMRNAERHIWETLESLASQSLADFEVIVVDDGSTDRSPQIVEEFGRRDKRFSLVSGPAVGSAGAARNAGLALARGEFIAFLDADDLFAPSMLEKLYSQAVQDNADVVLTGFRSFEDQSGEQAPQPWALRVKYLPPQTPFSPRDIPDYIFYVTNPANWNKLFRRSFVEQHGLRFQSLRRANDAYFTFVALAFASSVSYVAEELVFYRVGNADSLQGSIHESPLEFAEALVGIHASLEAADLITRYERAFKNLVVTMSLGALHRARTADAFVATYTAVRDNVFPRFGVSEAVPQTFLTGDARRRVAEIVEKPVAQWLFDKSTPRREEEFVQTGFLKTMEPEDELLVLRPNEGRVGQPDVSVIVPVHNASPWLHECLLSILGQSGVSVEVVCVDDGSTDDSLRILNEYASTDNRVKVVAQPNGGQSTARNRGLDLARGRYVCLIDSDDHWRLDALATLVSRADEESLDVLLYDAVSFFEPGVPEGAYDAFATYYTRSRAYVDVVTGAELIAAMRRGRDYRASPCLYLARRDRLEDPLLRFIPGIIHEDNPFTFSLLMRSRRVAHEKLAFYSRRVRPGSTMTGGRREASMRGYFVSFLEMQRELIRHALPADLSAGVGDLLHQIYVSSRKIFVELPEEIGDRILEVDSTPEAHCTYLMMKHDRSQAVRLRKVRS
jgi:glycosyltransferase involved in cell wall biosynthesis